MKVDRHKSEEYLSDVRVTELNPTSSIYQSYNLGQKLFLFYPSLLFLASEMFSFFLCQLSIA